WLKWERERPASMRDKDELELVRAALMLRKTLAASTPEITSAGSPYLEFSSYGTYTTLLSEEDRISKQETFPLQYPQIIHFLLRWLERQNALSPVTLDFLLDVSETALAHLDMEKLVATRETDGQRPDWDQRNQLSRDGSLSMLMEYHTWHGRGWSAGQIKRR